MSGDRNDAMPREGATDRHRSDREQALRAARRRHPSARAPRVAPGTAIDPAVIDGGEALEPDASPPFGRHPLVIVAAADPPLPAPE